MLCLGCGARMHLVQVVKDTTMLVPGYEHHTWQCSGCSTVERRMTFTSESTPPPMVAVELVQTAPVEPVHGVSALTSNSHGTHRDLATTMYRRILAREG